MNCSNCRTNLTDYVHHQLDDARDAAVFDHVQSCAACRAELNAELELSEMVRSALGDDRQMPASVLAGVRQAMWAPQTISALDRLRAVLRPAVLAPAAAAVIIAAIIGFGQAHRPGPTLSSDYYVRQHVAQTIGSPSSDPAWSAYLLTSVNAESTSDGASTPAN